MKVTIIIIWPLLFIGFLFEVFFREHPSSAESELLNNQLDPVGVLFLAKSKRVPLFFVITKDIKSTGLYQVDAKRKTFQVSGVDARMSTLVYLYYCAVFVLTFGYSLPNIIKFFKARRSDVS